VPGAVLLLATAPLALLSARFAIPAVTALAGLAALTAVDIARAAPPRHLRRGRLRFRMGVALHHLLQPLVRAWGRSRHRRPARRELAARPALPEPIRRLAHGVVLMPEDRPRTDLASAVLDELRRGGMRAVSATGWEDYDARLLASSFVYGDFQSSSHPVGYVQLRVRGRPRWRPLGAAAVVAAGFAAVNPALGVAVVAAAGAEVLRGLVRARLCLPWAVARATPAGAR
jgi:hypothetical protein